MPGLWRLYWLIVVATLAVYTVMLGWSLPLITATTQGLQPFDVRLGGYTGDQGRQFLTALFKDGPQARDFYLDVQQRLDMVFPILVAISLAVPLVRLSRGWPLLIRWLMSLLPWIGAGFDYGENALVRSMLHGLPDLPADRLVLASSQLTIFKGAFIAVSIILVLVLLVRRWLLLRQPKRRVNEVYNCD